MKITSYNGLGSKNSSNHFMSIKEEFIDTKNFHLMEKGKKVERKRDHF